MDLKNWTGPKARKALEEREFRLFENKKPAVHNPF